MGFFSKAGSGKFSFSIGILLIRFSIGFLFLLAGAKKILNLQEFIASVQETGQMHDTLAFILAFVLPFIEMFFGGLYIIGLFTPVASFFIACMTVSFLFVLGTGHHELPYSYNFVILSCAIATMFTGAGLISFDALIDREKHEPVKTKEASVKIEITDSKKEVTETHPDIQFAGEKKSAGEENK